VFGSLFVPLIGEALSGSDPDALDLEEGALLKYLIASPWTGGFL
jgi:hypothetical protein